MAWVLITLTLVGGALDAKVHSVHETMINCFEIRETVVGYVDQAVCVRELRDG
ncbi:MAG: hypothetical protein RIA64_08710 [Rhodospirillales bacterium]